MIFFQLAVIFGCLAVGELFVWLTGLPVPSSVVGMLALVALLQSGVVKIGQVERAADFLVKNMGFFFVPAGIGVMDYFGLIGREWMPIVGAAAVSTVVVLWVTGHCYQLFHRYSGRRNGR